MFTEKTICGFKDDIGYEIRYPLTKNDGIREMIDGLVEDITYYFENAFGKKIKEMLVKRKRGRAYGELYVTYYDDDYFSFVILLGGFDGNELTVFEYIPLNLDENGYIVPLNIYRGTPKRKNRPYFLKSENTVCLTEKTEEIPRIKIRKTELFELIRYQKLS